MNTIRVDIPEEELRAAIEYIGVLALHRDDDTPLSRAETTLDLALLEFERRGA
jgi:hypothetical protein